ncbi:MAG: S41 family peptidase [Chloroflexota bacterium]
MNWKRTLFTFFLLLLSLSLAFISGYFTYERMHDGSTADLNILEQARSVLENHALYKLPSDTALEYGMIRGMLQAYGDPYTRFVEPNQHELNSDNLEGSYGGIGAALDHDSEGYPILHPFPNSPASKASILDGDRIILVDDLVVTKDTPIDEIVAALRGPEGDSVDLTITRPPTHNSHSFTIQRESIPLPSVTWYLAPGNPEVGIIKINIIAASTSEEVQNAATSLKQQGVLYYTLDLRGNGGGLVDAGVDIARLFLEAGDVLEEQYVGEDIKTYSVTQAGALAALPLVILVDENTASAAEIVAGALQARERALIIGQATYGKDSIQLVFDLEDNSSIHVTSAKWWIPGLGLSIGEHGLQPDITIESGENPDPVIEAAIQLLTRKP